MISLTPIKHESNSTKMTSLALRNPLKVLVTGIDKPENQLTRAVSRYGCEVIAKVSDNLKTPPAFVDAVIIHTAQISHETFWRLKDFYAAKRIPLFVTKKGFTDIQLRFEDFLKVKNHPIPNAPAEVKTEGGLYIPKDWIGKATIPIAAVAESEAPVITETTPTLQPANPDDRMVIVKELVQEQDKPSLHERFKELYINGTPNSVIAETLNKEGYRRPRGGDMYTANDMGSLRQCVFKTRTLTVDPNDTPAYKRLAELHQQGLGYVAIAEILNSEGFKTNRYQNLFDGTAVANALMTIRKRSLDNSLKKAGAEAQQNAEAQAPEKVDITQLIAYVMSSAETSEAEKLRLIQKITEGEIKKQIYTEITYIDGIMLIERNNIALKSENNIRVELTKDQAQLIVENMETLKGFLLPKA